MKPLTIPNLHSECWTNNYIILNCTKNVFSKRAIQKDKVFDNIKRSPSQDSTQHNTKHTENWNFTFHLLFGGHTYSTLILTILILQDTCLIHFAYLLHLYTHVNINVLKYHPFAQSDDTAMRPNYAQQACN